MGGTELHEAGEQAGISAANTSDEDFASPHLTAIWRSLAVFVDSQLPALKQLPAVEQQLMPGGNTQLQDCTHAGGPAVAKSSEPSDAHVTVSIRPQAVKPEPGMAAVKAEPVLGTAASALINGNVPVQAGALTAPTETVQQSVPAGNDQTAWSAGNTTGRAVSAAVNHEAATQAAAAVDHEAAMSAPTVLPGAASAAMDHAPAAAAAAAGNDAAAAMKHEVAAAVSHHAGSAVEDDAAVPAAVDHPAAAAVLQEDARATADLNASIAVAVAGSAASVAAAGRAGMMHAGATTPGSGSAVGSGMVDSAERGCPSAAAAIVKPAAGSTACPPAGKHTEGSTALAAGNAAAAAAQVASTRVLLRAHNKVWVYAIWHNPEEYFSTRQQDGQEHVDLVLQDCNAQGQPQGAAMPASAHTFFGRAQVLQNASLSRSISISGRAFPRGTTMAKVCAYGLNRAASSSGTRSAAATGSASDPYAREASPAAALASAPGKFVTGPASEPNREPDAARATEGARFEPHITRAAAAAKQQPSSAARSPRTEALRNRSNASPKQAKAAGNRVARAVTRTAAAQVAQPAAVANHNGSAARAMISPAAVRVKPTQMLLRMYNNHDQAWEFAMWYNPQDYFDKKVSDDNAAVDALLRACNAKGKPDSEAAMTRASGAVTFRNAKLCQQVVINGRTAPADSTIAQVFRMAVGMGCSQCRYAAAGCSQCQPSSDEEDEEEDEEGDVEEEGEGEEKGEEEEESEEEEDEEGGLRKGVEAGGKEGDSGKRAVVNECAAASMEQQGSGCREQQRQGEPDVQPQLQRVCANCRNTKTRHWQKEKESGRFVCEKCYAYHKGTGHARPSRLFQQGRDDQPQPQQVCTNCGVTMTSRWSKDKGTGSIVCYACYAYQRRFGRARPYHTSQKDASRVRAAANAIRPDPPVTRNRAQKRTLEMQAAAGQADVQPHQSHKRIRSDGVPENALPAECAAGGHGTLQHQDEEHAGQLQQHVLPGFQGDVQQLSQQQQLQQQPPLAVQTDEMTAAKQNVADQSEQPQHGQREASTIAAAQIQKPQEPARQSVAASMEVDGAHAAPASCVQQHDSNTSAVIASTGAADGSKAADQDTAGPAVDMDLDKVAQAQVTAIQAQNIISTAAFAPQGQRPAAAAGQGPTHDPQLLIPLQGKHCGMHQQQQSSFDVRSNAARPDPSSHSTGHWPKLGCVQLSVAAQQAQTPEGQGSQRVPAVAEVLAHGQSHLQRLDHRPQPQQQQQQCTRAFLQCRGIIRAVRDAAEAGSDRLGCSQCRFSSTGCLHCIQAFTTTPTSGDGHAAVSMRQGKELTVQPALAVIVQPSALLPHVNARTAAAPATATAGPRLALETLHTGSHALSSGAIPAGLRTSTAAGASFVYGRPPATAGASTANRYTGTAKASEPPGMQSAGSSLPCRQVMFANWLLPAQAHASAGQPQAGQVQDRHPGTSKQGLTQDGLGIQQQLQGGSASTRGREVGGLLRQSCYFPPPQHGHAHPLHTTQQQDPREDHDVVHPGTYVSNSQSQKRKMEGPAVADQSDMRPLESHKRVRPGDLPDEVRPCHQAAGCSSIPDQEAMGQAKQQQQQGQQDLSQGDQRAVQQQAQQQQLRPASAHYARVEAVMQAPAVESNQPASSEQLLGSLQLNAAAAAAVVPTEGQKGRNQGSEQLLGGMRQSAGAGMPPHSQQQQADTGPKAAVAAADGDQQRVNYLPEQLPAAAVPAIEVNGMQAAVPTHDQQRDSNTPADVASTGAADMAGVADQDTAAPVVNVDLDSVPQAQVAVKKPQNTTGAVTAVALATQAAVATVPCAQEATQELPQLQQTGHRQPLPKPSTQHEGPSSASMPASQAHDKGFECEEQVQGNARSAAAAVTLPPDSQQLPGIHFSAAGTVAAAAIIPPGSQQCQDSIQAESGTAGTAAAAAAMVSPDTQQQRNDGSGAQAAVVAASSKQQPDSHKRPSLAFTGAAVATGATMEGIAATTVAMDLDAIPQAQVPVSKPQHVSAVGTSTSGSQGQAAVVACEREVSHLAQAHAGAASVAPNPSHPIHSSTDSDMSALPADLLQLLPALPADDGALIGAHFLNQVSCGMFKLLKAVGKAEWQREAVRALSAAFKTEEGRHSFQSLVYPMLLGAVQAGEKGMVVDVLADWLGKE